jgi:hypothetical protein
MANEGTKPEEGRRPSFRRRQLIVDKPFQYRLIATLAILWAASSLFFCLILYLLYQGHFQRFYLLVPRREVVPDLSLSTVLVLSIVFFLLFGFIVLGIIGAYLSNQIAGPLYRTKKCMERVGKGDLAFRLQFRQSDFLRDVPGIFNAMLEGLVRQEQSDVAALEAIVKVFHDPVELKRRVRELIERKHARAGLLKDDGATDSEPAIATIS